jgi:gluconolactonase
MKCDARGNVWVTGPGGVWVYAPGGDLLGKVRVPELAGNLHWGGVDFRTLFVTATHSVYTVPTKVGPRLEPFMRPRRTAAASVGEGATATSITPDRRLAPPPNGSERPDAGSPNPAANGGLHLDPRRCALIIQDMQNDVVMEGGAFASSGSPAHAKAQNVVENIRRLAEACRARGVMVIHVWFVVEPGAPGMTLNAPLFEGVVDSNALVRGTWGAAPVPGLEPKPGDMVVEKMRMSAWEGTRLETLLRSGERTVLINTGAWTNMSVEHTARTGADKGYFIVLPEDSCSTMNAAWHDAAVNYALQNVSAVTRTDAVLAALR